MMRAAPQAPATTITNPSFPRSVSLRAGVAVLPDEPELGEQKLCSRCGDWWPLTEEFWYRRCRRAGTVAWSGRPSDQPNGRPRSWVRTADHWEWLTPCRACWHDLRVERRARNAEAARRYRARRAA